MGEWCWEKFEPVARFWKLFSDVMMSPHLFPDQEEAANRVAAQAGKSQGPPWTYEVFLFFVFLWCFFCNLPKAPSHPLPLLCLR